MLAAVAYPKIYKIINRLSCNGRLTHVKRKLLTMRATLKYQIATYSGEIEVPCEPDEENEYIIARAKRVLKQKAGGSLPFGYESWKIVKRE